MYEKRSSMILIFAKIKLFKHLYVFFKIIYDVRKVMFVYLVLIYFHSLFFIRLFFSFERHYLNRFIYLSYIDNFSIIIIKRVKYFLIAIIINVVYFVVFID